MTSLAVNVLRRNTNNLGVIALGTFLPSLVVVVTQCDNSSGKGGGNGPTGILDTLLPKKADGSIYWDKATNQVTDQLFWDKLAKAAGNQVRVVRAVVPTGNDITAELTHVRAHDR
jgi:hypothetical protein